MKTKGLTLKEAIDSGRKFRRSSDGLYLNFQDYTMFRKDDVLAEDWELEPEAPKKIKLREYLVFSREAWGYCYNAIFLSDEQLQRLNQYQNNSYKPAILTGREIEVDAE